MAALIAQTGRPSRLPALAMRDAIIDQEVRRSGVKVRHEVFLVFTEAVDNIVKHSACSEIVIKLDIAGAVLRLERHDNGRGFGPRAPAKLTDWRACAIAPRRLAARSPSSRRRAGCGDHASSTGDYMNS